MRFYEVTRQQSNRVNAMLSKILGPINFTHFYNQKGGMFKLPTGVDHEVIVDPNDMKDAADLLMKDDGDIGFLFKQGKIRLVPAERTFEDMDPKGPEVKIGDYTTTHFYMCGSAIATAEKHADKPGMEKLVRLLDMLYKLERAVMDAGESTEDANTFAKQLDKEIMKSAKEIGIEDEVSEYQPMHLNSIIKGDPKPGFGRVDLEEEVTLEINQDFHEEFGELGYSIDEADMFAAAYRGRKVKLNKPMRGDVKKFKVYVKNKKGNVIKVNFGDPNMRIKKSNPARRRSFRARHNCDNPGPKTKARYWSCRKW